MIFATGCPLLHPTVSINQFLNFEMPEDLVEGYAYPEFTDEIKRKVLGQNFLNLHGIDAEELRRKTENDEWSRWRAEEDIMGTWDNFRASSHQAEPDPEPVDRASAGIGRVP